MEEFIWYPNIEIENSSGIREVSLHTQSDATPGFSIR